MKNKKIKIVEEPILNLKVEVDKSYPNITDGHKFEQRMNWPSFNYIDLVEVFQMNVSKGGQKDDTIPLEVAEKNALAFKRKLKAYIIEKADQSELENFDWSEWEIV
jgi:hypothetical protein